MKNTLVVKKCFIFALDFLQRIPVILFLFYSSFFLLSLFSLSSPSSFFFLLSSLFSLFSFSAPYLFISFADSFLIEFKKKVSLMSDAPLRAAKNARPNAMAQRLQFLSRASRSMIGMSPAVCSFLSVRMCQLAERNGIPIPIDSRMLLCERCETPLEVPNNCEVQIRSLSKRLKSSSEADSLTLRKGSRFVKKNAKGSGLAKNFVNYKCLVCKHSNLKKGTPKGYIKEKIVQEKARNHLKNMSQIKSNPIESIPSPIPSPIPIKSSNDEEIDKQPRLIVPPSLISNTQISTSGGFGSPIHLYSEDNAKEQRTSPAPRMDAYTAEETNIVAKSTAFTIDKPQPSVRSPLSKTDPVDEIQSTRSVNVDKLSDIGDGAKEDSSSIDGLKHDIKNESSNESSAHIIHNVTHELHPETNAPQIVAQISPHVTDFGQKTTIIAPGDQNSILFVAGNQSVVVRSVSSDEMIMHSEGEDKDRDEIMVVSGDYDDVVVSKCSNADANNDKSSLDLGGEGKTEDDTREIVAVDAEKIKAIDGRKVNLGTEVNSVDDEIAISLTVDRGKLLVDNEDKRILDDEGKPIVNEENTLMRADGSEGVAHNAEKSTVDGRSDLSDIVKEHEAPADVKSILYGADKSETSEYPVELISSVENKVIIVDEDGLAVVSGTKYKINEDIDGEKDGSIAESINGDVKEPRSNGKHKVLISSEVQFEVYEHSINVGSEIISMDNTDGKHENENENQVDGFGVKSLNETKSTDEIELPNMAKLSDMTQTMDETISMDVVKLTGVTKLKDETKFSDMAKSIDVIKSTNLIKSMDEIKSVDGTKSKDEIKPSDVSKSMDTMKLTSKSYSEILDALSKRCDELEMKSASLNKVFDYKIRIRKKKEKILKKKLIDSLKYNSYARVQLSISNKNLNLAKFYFKKNNSPSYEKLNQIANFIKKKSKLSHKLIDELYSSSLMEMEKIKNFEEVTYGTKESIIKGNERYEVIEAFEHKKSTEEMKVEVEEEKTINKGKKGKKKKVEKGENERDKKEEKEEKKDKEVMKKPIAKKIRAEARSEKEKKKEKKLRTKRTKAERMKSMDSEEEEVTVERGSNRNKKVKAEEKEEARGKEIKSQEKAECESAVKDESGNEKAETIRSNTEKGDRKLAKGEAEAIKPGKGMPEIGKLGKQDKKKAIKKRTEKVTMIQEVAEMAEVIKAENGMAEKMNKIEMAENNKPDKQKARKQKVEGMIKTEKEKVEKQMVGKEAKLKAMKEIATLDSKQEKQKKRQKKINTKDVLSTQKDAFETTLDERPFGNISDSHTNDQARQILTNKQRQSLAEAEKLPPEKKTSNRVPKKRKSYSHGFSSLADSSLSNDIANIENNCASEITKLKNFGDNPAYNRDDRDSDVIECFTRNHDDDYFISDFVFQNFAVRRVKRKCIKFGRHWYIRKKVYYGDDHPL